MCTLPLLAGDNISARFVVPTVATSVDLVVHLGLGADGVRRVNEIVSVPGRVEADVIEVEPIFVRSGARAAAYGRGARAASSATSGSASTSTRSSPPSRGRVSADGRPGRSRRRGRPAADLVGLRPAATPEAVHARRRRRSRRLLGRAGLGDVTPASVAVAVRGALRGRASPSCRRCRGRVPVAFVFAAMAAYVPIAVLRQRAARRLRDFAEVWPEAVDNLASAVRAGLSLPDAVAALGTVGPGGAAPRLRASSPSTTRSPGGSASASTGSRTGSPTRSGTG